MNKSFRLPAIVSIIAAAFAVYLPSLQNKFVWDDTALILRDPFIRSWRLIPQGIGHFLFTDATPSNFYRPIQRFTYTFDYALYAFHPWGYHLTNIILHAAAGVALFFLVQKLIERVGSAVSAKSVIIAWLAALAWVVHPAHSEAVIYIAGRADILAALFGFGGLYFGLFSLEKKSRALAWLAAFCFLAAVLSKESGVTALLIWLALLPCMGEFAQFRGWLIIAVAVLAAWGGLRFTAEHTPPPALDKPSTLISRMELLPRAFSIYSDLLVAPVNLHMERNIKMPGDGGAPQTPEDAAWRRYQIIGGLLLMAALILWLLWAHRRLFPAFLFLIAFIIAYAPTSNLFQLNARAAEHWLYFSSAFLFAAAALSLSVARVPRVLLLAIFACWLVFLGVRTWRRNFDWKDQRTFLETTMAAGGNTTRMMINLGSLESSEGHQDLAIADFKKALDERSDNPFALLGLAGAYMLTGDFDNAHAQLERARIDPFVHAEALKDLATLEYRQNGTVDLGLLAKAAGLEPDNWDIQSTYIKTLRDDGKTSEAVQVLRGVLDKQSYRSDSWKLMGDLLTKARRDDLAKTAYDYAREYDVHYGEVESESGK